MSYLKVIRIAVFVFPIVSLLLVLPFAIYHYRKYGTVSFLRSVILFSFFFYLLCTYFLVILPLPPRSEVANYTGAYYKLKPFIAAKDIITSGQFDISNPDTYIYLLNFKYLESFFNILMLIPFGIYLRYYFKCGFFKTMMFSFVLSLFFELTQLSGLYFIYPRPYRLCDTTDLINNTFGGVVGFLMAPLFSFFLPSRDKIDSNDYVNGSFVSVLRNGVSVFIDYFLIIILSFGIMTLFDVKYLKVIYLILSFICFVLISYISSGYTFGKWFLNIRNIGSSDDGSISIFKYFFRWIFLHLFLINGWVLISIFNNRVGHVSRNVWLVYFGFVFVFLIYCFSCLITKKDIFINKILGIDSISVIQLEDDEDEI